MFPILRLPYLALDNVIQYFCLQELVTLSMASTRCFRVVKFLLRRRRYSNIEMTMRLGFVHQIRVYQGDTDEFVISILDQDDLKKVLECRSMSTAPEGMFNGLEYNMLDNEPDRMVTYFENVNMAIKMFYEHFVGLFDKEIVDLCYFPDEDNMHFEMLESIRKNQKTVRSGSACFYTRERETYKIALEKLQIIENLFLECKYSEEETSPINTYKFKSLTIDDGDWVTLPKLLNIASERIHITQRFFDGSSLHNRELNKYLQCWVTGICPTVKDFCLVTNGTPSLPKILEGVKFELSEERMEVDEEWERLRGGPLCIRRATDGAVARVDTLDTYDEDEMDITVFRMQVLE